MIRIDQTRLPALLRQHLDKPLSAVPLTDYDDDPAEYALRLEAGADILSDGAFHLAFDREISARIDLFRSRQADRDGIIGRPEAVAAGAPVLPPLSWRQGDAWLKYTLENGVQTPMSTTEGPATLSLGAGGRITLLSYRHHAPGERLWDALRMDITPWRSILSLPDVQALRPREAMVMKTRQTLFGTVSFRFSDLLSRCLGRIARALEIRGMMQLEIGAALQASGEWEIHDDFLLVITRRDDSFSVAVKSAHGKSVAGGFSLAVHWLPDFRPLLTDVLKPLLADLSGNLKQTISEIVHQALKKEAEFGLSAEYRRLDSRSVLFEATVPAAELARFHPQLLRGEHRDLLREATAGANGLELVRFLREKSTVSENAWGVVFGIGGWKIGARRDKRYVVTEWRDGAERKCIHLEYARGFEDYLGRGSQKFHIDFVAEMPTFSPSAEPLAEEFATHMLLSMKWSGLHLSALPAVLDQAEVWGGEARIADGELLPVLTEKLRGKGRINAVCQLRLRHPALRAILPALGALDNAAWCTALAAAMPFDHEAPTTPAQRMEWFTPIWNWYFHEPRSDDRRRREYAVRALAGHSTHLARNEEFWEKLVHLSFTGLTHINPIVSSVQRFTTGARELDDAGASGAGRPYRVIGAAWEKMREMAETAFYCRALGYQCAALLKERYAEFGGDFEITLCFAYRDGQTEKTINIALGRPG